MQSPRVQHNWQRARVQHNWRSTQVRRNWQGHGTWRHRHHHRYYGYYGGYWGFAPLYGGTYIYPPGVYGGDCRLVKRHVRVLTDRGWRWRWRTYRICY